jgi:hypothetical protein
VSEPRPYRQPYGYPGPNPYPQPYPRPPQAYPQPAQVPARWADQFAPWSSYPTLTGVGDRRLFQVRVTKHTGLVMAWYNQRYTVTGTLAQCEAAIHDAQQHNLAAGWWSIASLLVWNWVALAENAGARKVLHRQAAQRRLSGPSETI